MCGTYFNLKALPPVKGYDVHIYFNKENEWAASEIAQAVRYLFPNAVAQEIHRIDAGRGPHAQTNYGLGIKPESFGEVVSWLQRNNSEKLSILVHPKTGDEKVDHLDSALWLGKPVDFRMEFFNSLKLQAPKGPKAA